MTQVKQRVDGVFEGGGVKGIGLVGAVSVIEAAGYEFVNLAGTSAGAIVATLLAAGYHANELKSIISGLDFSSFEDPPLIGHVPLLGAFVDMLLHKGLYKGDVFLNLMRDLLARKKIHTFRDLLLPEFANDERYRFKVRAIASDISRGRMLVLPQDVRDYGMAPEDLEVALAVRMSMSIPFFFEPVKFRESYIVDGGVLSNFPVELFDSAGEPEWPTFGFKLVLPEQAASAPVVEHPINGPFSELAAMFFTAMEAHDAYYLKNDKFVRTIAIDTLNIDATDFNLSVEQKEALYASGMQAAQTFLAHWNFEQYKALYRSGQPVPSRREQVLPTLAQPTTLPPVSPQ
jgi:NTE family protein